MTMAMSRLQAMRRGVGALVRGVGAARVGLRVASLPVAGDAGEELGLRTPEFQELELWPAAVRRTDARVEVLVPADALEKLLGVSGAGAVRAVVDTLAAVVIEDEAFAVTGLETLDAAAGACMYRIVLRPNGTDEV